MIDTDQGQSGASAADREGFQRLVADVGLGKAGIVLGLEVSRLARNNADWHRLLEICALTGTLICDEDGLYDPADFNDRLLLGLKGTMSEAELHFIRARLQRRASSPKPAAASCRCRSPSGWSMTRPARSCSTPTRGVQHALRHLFATFAADRLGARGRPRVQRATGCCSRPGSAPATRKGELAWTPLRHWRVLRTLHNPRYAGAFVYGRRRTRKTPDGQDHRRSSSRASNGPR